MGHGGGVEIPDQPRHDNDVALQPQALSLLSHQIGMWLRAGKHGGGRL